MNGKQKLWGARIDEWKRSGLSQREVDTPEETQSTELVEIPVKKSEMETPEPGTYRLAVEVGRYTVGLYGAFDADEFSKLLDLLESR